MSKLGLSVLAVAEENGGLAEWLLPDAAELIWGLVAFALLMGFLSWKVFPVVGQTLDERANSIQGQITEAEAVRAEAEQLRERYEAQLADARRQATGIVEDAKAQAERMRADIVTSAEEEATQLIARARTEVEAERSRLVQDLRQQVAVLSVQLASRIVQRELDPQSHQALVDQYINELSGLN